MQAYIDTLVNKAYNNWAQILEYDCKETLIFEQNKNDSPLEVLPCHQDFSVSVDQQESLQTLLASLTPDLTVTGKHFRQQKKLLCMNICC